MNKITMFSSNCKMYIKFIKLGKRRFTQSISHHLHRLANFNQADVQFVNVHHKFQFAHIVDNCLLVVPMNAVSRGNMLLVEGSEGQPSDLPGYTWRQVELGMNDDYYVEIVSGVQEGQFHILAKVQLGY